MKRLIAMMLVLALLLCGCGGGAKNALGFSGIVKFEDMEYNRPDMGKVAELCDAAIAEGEKGRDVDATLNAVWDFFDIYDEFVTSYDLAYIHYQANLTDFYWQTEYEWCAEELITLDKHLEDLYCALALSPLRDELEEEYFGEGFFLSYDEGGMYNEELMALLEQEQALVSEYYTLSGESQAEEAYSEAYFETYTQPLAQLLADLTATRQDIALAAGYDSYPEFVWDFYYYRDYTAEEAASYLEDIRRELVPLYENLDGEVFHPAEEFASEEEVFSYVQTAAEEMGGVVWEAFRLLDEAELYDLSASPNKSGISFETYLSRYYEPYVFLSGTGTAYDKLSFAHEFGHFATDYAAAGSGAGIDVLEVFSQGMEYLSLCYAGADDATVDMKLADSLCTYVEQAGYAAFEMALYALEAEELTAEKVLEVYEETGRSYAFDTVEWDPREVITVPHFYSNPMYIISYVGSNDAAMQLYQMELEAPGTGRDAFIDSLDTQEGWFMAFLEEADLESPFTRIDEVRDLMADHFG